MIRVIEGKVYNTETADEIHMWTNGYNESDYLYRERTLYQTKKGNWFIYHEGGPASDMAERVGSSTFSGSSDIEAISEDEAFEFLSEFGGDRALLRLFPEKCEDA